MLAVALILAASLWITMAVKQHDALADPNNLGSPAMIEAAWAKALTLAKVGREEAANWPTPHVEIIQRKRFIQDPFTGEPYRLCGQTQAVLEGTRENNTLQFYVGVFVGPDEGKLAESVLTHEFLHVIWGEKAQASEAFWNNHPDSEKYVRSLIPVDCPAN
jgi:hypothetical protein